MSEPQDKKESFVVVEEKFSPEAKKYFNETIYPEALKNNKHLATELELFKNGDDIKKRAWADYKSEILKQAKKVTGFEGINLSPLKDQHDNWFITKFNGAISGNETHMSAPYNHVQLFEEVNRAEDISKQSLENHNAVTSTAPKTDDDTRIVIKTPRALRDDPELDKRHKDAILRLATHAGDGYTPYFEMQQPERIVLIYKKDEKGNLKMTDAFAGEIRIADGFDGHGGSEHGSVWAPPSDAQDHRTYNTISTDQVSIAVQSHYNPQVGNSQRFDGALYLDVESGSKWRESDNTQPIVGQPTPESAQKFLDKVDGLKDMNLITKNAPTMPENVLLAALDAVRPGQVFEGAPRNPRATGSEALGLKA